MKKLKQLYSRYGVYTCCCVLKDFVVQHRTELESCRKKLKESQEKLKNHFKTGDAMQRHKGQTATFSDICEKSGYLLKKPDQLLNFKL